MFGIFFRRKLFNVRLYLFRGKVTTCTTHMAANTAYFRHIPDEPVFHVSLRVVHPTLAVDKQFNFCRQMTEPCSAFIARIYTNVEKVVSKKLKIKNKKNKGSSGNEEIAKVDPGGKVELKKDDIVVEDGFLCQEIFSSPGNFTLHIYECLLPVVINSPWVESIALPKSIMAGFYVYPSKFDQYFVDVDKSEWVWSRSKRNNGPWDVCGTSWLYETNVADIGCFLKLTCVPKNLEERCGPTVDTISPGIVEAGPGLLPCETRHKFTPPVVDPNTYRVVSYNILADLYVDSEYSQTVLFGYCPTYALDINYRKQILFKELLGYNADVICLQEVDSKVFRYDLEPVFKSIGILGRFCAKGDISEGTAVLFRENKLKHVQSWRVVLADLLQNDPLFVDVYDCVRLNPSVATRFAERYSTLQVELLECVPTGKLLLVANTHLYFHPDADGIRLLQGTVAIKYLERLLCQLREEVGCYIICSWFPMGLD